MPVIERTRILVDCSFASRFGQIGRPVKVDDFNRRLTGFLSSPEGMRFITATLEKLAGRPVSGAAGIRATMFQQGYFQFVFRVDIKTRSGIPKRFCLIVSKGNPQFDTDRIAEDEFKLLSHYYQRLPGFLVEPLVFDRTDLVLYSSRYYSDHLELDYKIDGVNGRHGLYINSDRAFRPFSGKEQDRLLEEMVKILVLAYDESSGIAIGGLKVSSGDFIVKSERERLDLKLICVRSAERRKIPAFICDLLEYTIGLSTHQGFLFDVTTIHNGLVKAFLHNGLSKEAAVHKATHWMSQYQQALERGELDSLKRFWATLRYEAGLDGLPVYRHKRTDV